MLAIIHIIQGQTPKIISETALHLSCPMSSRILFLLLLAVVVDCNSEGDVLYAWKTKLGDPNNVLESWDPTLVNPCTWLHVTCNMHNTVVRLDLGNAGLSGPLIPQLGLLENLQYLEVFRNRINGTIPTELGNLKNLVSLDLYNNVLTGSIPTSLGNLKLLRFLRLNSNKLTGTLPLQIANNIINTTGYLMILNVSDNMLKGRVRALNSYDLAVATIIQDPKSSPK